MSFNSLDSLVAAMNSSLTASLIFSAKASSSNQLTGGYSSVWTGSGLPAAGATPGAAEICTKAMVGAVNFPAPIAGKKWYMVRAFVNVSSIAAFSIFDRLAHNGGLSGTLTTAQAVDVSVGGADGNMAARIGSADFSEVQWFLEWYTDTGSTAVTATITYTSGAGVEGRTVTVAMAATMRRGRALPIVGIGGEPIKSVQSVQLSASTGAAGSFGVTAVRAITEAQVFTASGGVVSDWAQLGLPLVEDDACLFILYVSPSASGSTFTGRFVMAQG